MLNGANDGKSFGMRAQKCIWQKLKLSKYPAAVTNEYQTEHETLTELLITTMLI